MKKFLTVCILVLLCSASNISAAAPAIVPLPVEMIELDGEFVFASGTAICHDRSELAELSLYLEKKTHGLARPCNEFKYTGAGRVVSLAIDPSMGLGAEAYRLDINPGKVTIIGTDRAGVFYGIQTLLQLMPADLLAEGARADRFSVPCLSITDYPRFGYRGFLLDVGRRFTPAGDVMKLLERMAFHKLNKFHWHLTDDEGWRIYLDSHPRLALEGGFRGGDSPVRNIYGKWGEKYGGYYTKEEIRQVVEYASFLNIEVIPEFDLPGHSRAAACVYPEILCRGPVDTSASAGYDLRKVWCASREDNYRIITEILEEMCELFPSSIIYTGGDEVPPEQWETCPDCQALMKREGLADTKELNTWFGNRMGEILEEMGRRHGVWNETADGGELTHDAVVYAWENEGSVVRSVEKGLRTVAMPSEFYYLDMKQSPGEYGLQWRGIIDLKRVYDHDPVPAGYPDSAIMGVECALWGETYLWNGDWWGEYQMFPRMCAMAETAWTPSGRKNWPEFKKRIDDTHLARLSAMGIGYRDENNPVYMPSITGGRKGVKYTLSGSVPAMASNPYSYACDDNNKTTAKTVRTPVEGDWFEYKFAAPLTCKSIMVRSGYASFPRYVVGPAVLEVSYDGSNYEVVDDNFGYVGTFEPRSAVHKIKLTLKGTGNGEEMVIIQDLVIR